MTRVSRILRCAAFLSAFMLTACSATPSQRWMASSEALITARETILTLHQADIIGDADLVRADKVEKVARGALAVAKTQLPDGGESFEEWLSVARGALRELALSYDTTLDGITAPTEGNP